MPETGVLRFVAFGDCGSGSAGQHAVAQALRGESVPPDLVMIVGDVVYTPFDAASYDAKFFAPYAALLPQIPFYALPGNHDYEFEGGRPFFEVFSLPRNGPAGLAPESSYWLERAGVQMIVHDTNQSVATLRQQSLPWHSALARQAATFRLVFQHHTLYSSGPSFDQTPDARAARAARSALRRDGRRRRVRRARAPLRAHPSDRRCRLPDDRRGRRRALPATATGTPFTAAFANDRHGYTYVEVSGRTLRLRQMDTAGARYDALELTKPVAAADPLLSFAGKGAPPREWRQPGYDDSAWREAARAAGPLQARRGFDVARPALVSEAVLRVGGASDYRVLLNDVLVARGGFAGDDAPASFTSQERGCVPAGTRSRSRGSPAARHAGRRSSWCWSRPRRVSSRRRAASRRLPHVLDDAGITETTMMPRITSVKCSRTIGTLPKK